jgi:predicted RNase H-like nuclease
LSARSFLGIDLGWYGKPTGLAALEFDGDRLRLRSLTRIEPLAEILEWVRDEAGAGDSIAAIDAPTVIANAAGIRDCERGVNANFRRFHAGCHPANLGRPFAPYVLAFSKHLENLGFRHGADIEPKSAGRYQLEVHPHSATVSMFGLDRIVKYKKGRRKERSAELARLRQLCLDNFPKFDPALPLELPEIPAVGPTKPAEDQIDAVICAYIAAHYWYWGRERNTVFGTAAGGFIVVPAKGSATP